MRERTDLKSAIPGKLRTISFTARADSVTAVNGPRTGIDRYISDVVTPNFKELVNKGAIINNPMTKQTLTFDGGGAGWQRYDPVSATITGNAYRDDYQYYIGNGVVPGLNSITTASFPLCRADWASEVIDHVPLKALASTQALSRIKKPDVEAIVFVAELQKTLDTLRNPLGAITQYVRKYGNGLKHPKVRGSREAKAIANQYLGVYYGILPVMNDVDGILKALERQIRPRYTARGEAVAERNRTMRTTTVDNGLDVFTYQDTCYEKVYVRAGSLYGIVGDSHARYVGAGFGNIPSALWELTPYSFVADWVLNLGEFIQAITPMLDVVRYAEWHAVQHTVTWRRGIVSHTIKPGIPSWQITRACGDWQRVAYEGYIRQPVDLGRHVGIQVRPKLNTWKTLAAISLAVQSLTQKVK